MAAVDSSITTHHEMPVKNTSPENARRHRIPSAFDNILNLTNQASIHASIHRFKLLLKPHSSPGKTPKGSTFHHTHVWWHQQTLLHGNYFWKEYIIEYFSHAEIQDGKICYAPKATSKPVTTPTTAESCEVIKASEVQANVKKTWLFSLLLTCTRFSPQVDTLFSTLCHAVSDLAPSAAVLRWLELPGTMKRFLAEYAEDIRWKMETEGLAVGAHNARLLLDNISIVDMTNPYSGWNILDTPSRIRSFQELVRLVAEERVFWGKLKKGKREKILVTDAYRIIKGAVDLVERTNNQVLGFRILYLDDAVSMMQKTFSGTWTTEEVTALFKQSWFWKSLTVERVYERIVKEAVKDLEMELVTMCEEIGDRTPQLWEALKEEEGLCRTSEVCPGGKKGCVSPKYALWREVLEFKRIAARIRRNKQWDDWSGHMGYILSCHSLYNEETTKFLKKVEILATWAKVGSKRSG
ncbi:hypothetical protein FPQ18DRAFT_382793 [Pyronema domesticum]|nr:hypothetical protein FPQ18DRAFT_382793 [Pyronema domesticum]